MGGSLESLRALGKIGASPSVLSLHLLDYWRRQTGKDLVVLEHHTVDSRVNLVRIDGANTRLLLGSVFSTHRTRYVATGVLYKEARIPYFSREKNTVCFVE